MASSFRKPNGFFKGFEITGNDGSLMKPAVLFGVGNNRNQQLFLKIKYLPNSSLLSVLVFNTRCTPACSGVGWLLSFDPGYQVRD
jgi:hypothetical protein